MRPLSLKQDFTQSKKIKIKMWCGCCKKPPFLSICALFCTSLSLSLLMMSQAAVALPQSQRERESIMASLESVSQAEADSKCVADLRLVLLGLTGSGRSSLGNSLLGASPFPVGASLLSVTRCCHSAQVTAEGRSLQVIDTPGFFHTCLSPEEVRAEAGLSVSLSAPGPNVFLLVHEVGRATSERCSALAWHPALFGPTALHYTLLVLTGAQKLVGQDPESYLRESQELWELASRCEGGFYALDNGPGRGRDGDGADLSQVRGLLQKVEALVERNEGGYYTCEMFQHAQTVVLQAQRRMLGEKEEGLMEGEGPEKEEREEQKKKEEEEKEAARKKAEREFWLELVSAMGKGALEASGVMEKGKGKGKKCKAVQRAAAFASTPLSITSAAKAVGGAVREGTKVLYKHRKAFLQ